MKYLGGSFTVGLGASKQFRDNYDKIFPPKPAAEASTCLICDSPITRDADGMVRCEKCEAAHMQKQQGVGRPGSDPAEYLPTCGICGTVATIDAEGRTHCETCESAHAP